jgi:hypothetical protein
MRSSSTESGTSRARTDYEGIRRPSRRMACSVRKEHHAEVQNRESERENYAHVDAFAVLCEERVQRLGLDQCALSTRTRAILSGVLFESSWHGVGRGLTGKPSRMKPVAQSGSCNVHMPRMSASSPQRLAQRTPQQLPAGRSTGSGREMWRSQDGVSGRRTWMRSLMMPMTMSSPTSAPACIAAHRDP